MFVLLCSKHILFYFSGLIQLSRSLMEKRLEDLNQIGNDIRTNESNKSRTLLLASAVNAISDALQKLKKPKCG